MDEHANDDLYFGDTKLEHVSVYKYLGIQMNAWLTWTDHVDYVRKKVEKRWAALEKWFCHPFLPIPAKKSLWDLGIAPLILYGAEVVDYPEQVLDTFERKQHDCACKPLSIRTSASKFGKFWELNWVSIKLLYYAQLTKYATRLDTLGGKRLAGSVRRDTAETPCPLEQAREDAAQLFTAEEPKKMVMAQYMEAMCKRKTMEKYRQFSQGKDEMGCGAEDNWLYEIPFQQGLRLRSKFRLGAHALYLNGIHCVMRKHPGGCSDDDHLCPLCRKAPETVAHFLLKCPTTMQLRTKFLERITLQINGQRVDLKNSTARGSDLEKFWPVTDYEDETLVDILLGFVPYDLDGPGGSAYKRSSDLNFTATVAEMMESLWTTRSAQLDSMQKQTENKTKTRKTGKTKKQQATNERRRQTMDGLHGRSLRSKVDNPARRDARLFFAHRGVRPTAPTRGDGVDGDNAMT